MEEFATSITQTNTATVLCYQLIRMSTGHMEGDLQPAFILLTNYMLYILRRGEKQGHYSTQQRLPYTSLDYISVSFELLMHNLCFSFSNFGQCNWSMCSENLGVGASWQVPLHRKASPPPGSPIPPLSWNIIIC